ncbi:MAG: hypothetical protein KGQ41_01975 [Alphaproteobacteria bacterium]|nr:hypothetical protein [Alphaproteobacteria bacterium]
MTAPQNQKRKFALRLPRLPWWGWGIAGAVLVGIVVSVAMSMPEQGSWRYGACKVFLQRYIKYPESIRFIAGGETMSTVSIVFSDTNPFGAQQIRVFECLFSNPDGRLSLSKITMDRKPIPDEIVKTYNALLPTLAGIELETELPPPPPNSLENLKED